MYTPFATANDGTIFNAESDEVIAYLAEFPNVSVEAAIGSVVMVYNRQIEDVIVEDEEATEILSEEAAE